jgi:hypothetical protein
MAATLYEIKPNKTYATKKNVEIAVAKVIPEDSPLRLRYFIHTHTDGRFFPVFIGTKAVEAGIHFHFNVVA